MGNYFKMLDWDSQFFGYKIAAFKPSNLEINELHSILRDLSMNSFKLAYCFVKPSDEISNHSLKSVSGLLVDEKITFITKTYDDKYLKRYPDIKQYDLPYASEKLKFLALQSGVFSRFKIDPNFHNDEFKKLYFEWIEKSVKKEISDEILVYFDNEEEKGFITLVIKDNVGSIGLIAVDENERGKSIGRKLVHEAFCYFNEKKTDSVEVVSQLANKGACEFYKSLGFEVKNVVNIYHLWIK
jgi:dTDP-4-amino-4,6-dideoxy-D-galactose acyltransferase